MFYLKADLEREWTRGVRTGYEGALRGLQDDIRDGACLAEVEAYLESVLESSSEPKREADAILRE